MFLKIIQHHRHISIKMLLFTHNLFLKQTNTNTSFSLPTFFGAALVCQIDEFVHLETEGGAIYPFSIGSKPLQISSPK